MPDADNHDPPDRSIVRYGAISIKLRISSMDDNLSVPIFAKQRRELDHHLVVDLMKSAEFCINKL